MDGSGRVRRLPTEVRARLLEAGGGD
jgi:hypothetical protein